MKSRELVRLPVPRRDPKTSPPGAWHRIQYRVTAVRIDTLPSPARSRHPATPASSPPLSATALRSPRQGPLSTLHATSAQPGRTPSGTDVRGERSSSCGQSPLRRVRPRSVAQLSHPNLSPQGLDSPLQRMTRPTGIASLPETASQRRGISRMGPVPLEAGNTRGTSGTQGQRLPPLLRALASLSGSSRARKANLGHPVTSDDRCVPAYP
jgi:hypothetical protein